MYRIRIYENNHYMMEEEAYDHATFEKLEDALAKAKEIVLDFFSDGQYLGKPLDDAKGQLIFLLSFFYFLN